MSQAEYTKEDLIKWMREHSKEDKVSLDDLAGLVADPRFPQALAANAWNELVKDRDDRTRLGQLIGNIKNGIQQHEQIQRQISSAQSTISGLEQQAAQVIQDLEKLSPEFEEIQARIAERQGRHSGNAGK